MHLLKCVLAWPIFILLLFPLTFILFMLFILHFIITKVLRLIFKKDLVPFDNGLEANFLNDYTLTHPKNSISFFYVIEGKVEENNVKNKLLSSLFCAESGKSYSERLTSIVPTTWLGYGFWKKLQEPFDISNHFNVIKTNKTQSQFEKDALNRIIYKWTNSTYKKNCPLWDTILIIGNDFSVFGMRNHHIIGDAYSNLHFTDKLFDVTPAARISGSKIVSKSGLRSLLNLFWAPLAFMHILTSVYSKNLFFTNEREEYLDSIKVKLPLSKLKELKNFYNNNSNNEVKIPLISVLLQLFAQNYKKELENEIKCRGGAKTEFKIGLSLPKENKAHPYGIFCNHWSCVIYKVPLCSQDEKINLLKNDLDFVNQVNLLGFFALFLELHLYIPAFIIKLLHKTYLGGQILASNMPGPIKSVSLCNHAVKEMYSFNGIQSEIVAIYLTAVSYNGMITIILNGKADMLKLGPDFRKINEEIDSELKLFEHLREV